MKVGTLRKILSTFEEEEDYHGYEIHKKTGISLRYIYKALGVLTKAGLIKENGSDPRLRRKYFLLTENGKVLRRIFQKVISDKKVH